jgi:hydroxyacylglutathione hydrolase
MHIEQLYTNCLAEAAYYIESNGEAAIIDPLRETEPYIALAKKRGARIKYVLETHFHADFVSGHLDLAREANAAIVFGPGAETDYPVYNAKDGEELHVGKLTFRILHTPGHTPESTCYLVLDEEGKPHAIFTGDTVFVGDVGRPDLLDGKMSSGELASMMYDSLNQKIKTLPDDVIVYPAHGPGSACGKNIGKETHSTIGEQKKFNYALREMSREDFVREVTEGILPAPRYFAEDARINKSGYDPIAHVIRENKQPLSAEQAIDAVRKGALILDTRNPDDFARGHVPESLNIGLNGQYAPWVGTLIDIRQPLVLITEAAKEEESILRLARVGYENVVGYLRDGIQSWNAGLDSILSITAEQLRSAAGSTTVLDVRKPSEWAIARLKGARFVPLSEMPANFSELDKTQPYIVHCGGGYRSMIAISLMKRHGFHNLINVSGGFGAMQNAGLEIVSSDVVEA